MSGDSITFSEIVSPELALVETHSRGAPPANLPAADVTPPRLAHPTEVSAEIAAMRRIAELSEDLRDLGPPRGRPHFGVAKFVGAFATWAVVAMVALDAVVTA
jgi:hypothetical protein